MADTGDKFGRFSHTLFSGACVVLIVGGLKISAAVTMPVVVAFFLVMLVWPLQRRMEKWLSPGLSLVFTISSIFIALVIFGGILYSCINVVAATSPGYDQRITELLENTRAWAVKHRIPFPEELIQKQNLFESAFSALGGMAVKLYNFVGYFLLINVFLILGLLEVRIFRHALESVDDRVRVWKDILCDLSHTLHRFILARSLTSVITGVLTFVFSLIVGVQMPLIWGTSAVVLKFVPILGPATAVFLPAASALMQDNWTWLVPVTIVGLTVVQCFTGYFVDPRLQGRFVKLSPFVVLSSILFWSWIWGVAGALLSVPFTVGLVTILKHFEETRWIAELVSYRKDAYYKALTK
ncbi:MAG: AI-2E family transporter [Verrucomicrobia bacterium]|nr:AI-2E family transporter [Verrucomicrobiota bacterium]MCF7707479.1 AI-2E family transporter [Verrucomicrobiota bacterium]